jgi:hypothetical protein
VLGSDEPTGPHAEIGLQKLAARIPGDFSADHPLSRDGVFDYVAGSRHWLLD